MKANMVFGAPYGKILEEQALSYPSVSHPIADVASGPLPAQHILLCGRPQPQL